MVILYYNKEKISLQFKFWLFNQPIFFDKVIVYGKPSQINSLNITSSFEVLNLHQI